MLRKPPEHRSLIMGILNVTPDSFSGDGLMVQGDYVKAACDLAMQMVEDGADILDIGGESSRPGAATIPVDEEIRRTAPVIEAIRKKLDNAIISIDTVKAKVAEAALDAGASIVNDISALVGDLTMGSLIAKRGTTVVLMHNRSRTSDVNRDAKIGGEYGAADYGDVVRDVMRDLRQSIDAAKQAGIPDDKIILDPGIGFGKTVGQNMALINHAGELKKLGYPLLIGPSRKSFIGRVLDTDVEERLEGTAACVAASVMRGADIIRVHDVKFMARVAKMAAAIQAS